MMKIIAYPLIILTSVLTILVWITQILKLLYLVDKGIALTDFLRLVILVIPSLFFMISPLITVLAIIYAYNYLQNKRQIIILKTSSLSNLSIAKPALIVASLVAGISYYVSLYLMPMSYGKLKSELNHFKENYISSVIDERTFNQISKYLTIYVDKKNDDGVFEGVILFDTKEPEQRTVLFAKTGRIIRRDNIPLFFVENGSRQAFDKNHNLTRLHFDSLTVEIKHDDNLEADRNRTSAELYVGEMLWPDQNLSVSKKNRLMIDGHQRIIWPFFNYLLVLISLKVFLNQPYNRKSHLRQIIYTFVPVFGAVQLHFTLQKIAYQHPDYIVGCYINILCWIIFGLWQNGWTRINTNKLRIDAAGRR